MKNRIKSYSFWTALAGAAVVLMEALGKCFGFSVDNEIVTGVVMAVAGLLVVLGIVTMPKGESSDKQDQTSQESNQTQEQEDANHMDESQNAEKETK